MSDNFITLREMVKNRIKEVGGRVSFKELIEWAKETEIGSIFVLYALIKDLLDQHEVVALEGYEELPELMMWQVPKVLALPQAMQVVELGKELKETEKPKLDVDFEKLDEDIKKALTYLSEYWSVGEIRFKLDLKRQGVQDPDKVVYRLLDMNVIDLTPSGVINLKVEIPRMKGPSLRDFI